MSGLADKRTRDGQLHKFDDLERRIISSTPASPRLQNPPVKLNTVIAASIKNIKRESDRVLVDIEDDLLRFKATEYSRLWKTLECTEGVILGLLRDQSGLEKRK